MYTDETEERVLEGRPTLVFDAIDNIDTKVRALSFGLCGAGGPGPWAAQL